jgi:hypothetical protein
MVIMAMVAVHFTLVFIELGQGFGFMSFEA